MGPKQTDRTRPAHSSSVFPAFSVGPAIVRNPTFSIMRADCEITKNSAVNHRCIIV